MRNEKGQFKKGFGGRPKGAKNKTSGDIRSKIEGLIDSNFEQLEQDLETLQPSDRVKAYLKLLEFVVPKQRHVEQKIDLANLSEAEINSLYDRASELVFANTTDEQLEQQLKELGFEQKDNQPPHG